MLFVDLQDSVTVHLQGLGHLKNEFVAFFINYLRDQAKNLMNSSESFNTTPAKTPLSAKIERHFSKSNEYDSSVVKSKSTSDVHSSKKVKLFCDNESRIEADGDDNLGKHMFATDSYSMRSNTRNYNVNSNSRQQNEGTPKSQRSINFKNKDYTPR